MCDGCFEYLITPLTLAKARLQKYSEDQLMQQLITTEHQMPLVCLNSKQLYDAILNGCQCLIEQEEHLNKINVFPVPDGDTGSNLCATAKAVTQYAQENSTIKDTLLSIAEASIIGARGNSGMIFSQFFNGLHENIDNTDGVTLNDFSTLLYQTALSVRQAILSPIDGTMLTVMEAWADLANQTAVNLACFKESMLRVLPMLEQTVENTKEKLAVLKESDVVDAGALGFYYFVQGFTRHLHADEKIEINNKPTDIEIIKHLHQHDNLTTPPAHRYCTEGVIRGTNIDKNGLKNQLAALGDSLVLSGSNTLCRFHIHTNTPELVYSQLLETGTLQHPKVDDMHRQVEMTQPSKKSIALVMDSCADVPQVLQDRFQIHVLPINLHLDEHHLLDGYSFEPDSFYQNLNSLNQYPKTSRPSTVMVEKKIAQLATSYEDVIIITVSQALSGTHDEIVTAANKHPNVHVINSKSSAGAQGLLVNYAGELIEAGHEIKTILNALNNTRENTRIFVAIEQFDSLIRSGRISMLKGKLAQLTGIKPIISINSEGQGHIQGKALNTSKAMRKLITYVNHFCEEKQRKLKNYCIVHAGVAKKAATLSLMTTEAFRKPPAYIEHVSTAIGLHAGFGAVAVAIMLE